jgi:hypothetical protein
MSGDFLWGFAAGVAATLIAVAVLAYASVDRTLHR